ncbi:unnamed protein product, partial [Prorocentrum cordatum]
GRSRPPEAMAGGRCCRTPPWRPPRPARRPRRPRRPPLRTRAPPRAGSATRGSRSSRRRSSEAHWYFASALELLMVGSGGLAERDVEVRGLLGHQGFALVCDEKFREGAALLEHHIRSEGLTEGTAHLLNALGFARFRMGDYERAELAFEAGSRAEPQNPIMWNNLAAVKMMRGRLGEADGAMYQALDRTLPGQRGKEAQWVVGDYHRWMFQSNAVNLASRASGAKAGMPQVDLWWAERPAAKK